jgi:hypothetical protein
MNIHRLLWAVPGAGLLALAGCATPPPAGPSHMALPGSGMSFNQFRADDAECRAYADDSIGGQTAANATADANVRSAVAGTVIGAVAGAAIGGRDGAAVGAGTGLLVGSASGADAGNYSGRELQRRYDMRYDQCMYAKGHRVPLYGQFTTDRSTAAASTNAPYVPPPPPPSQTQAQ